MRLVYRRCEFRGAEWASWIADGFRTVAVNSAGIALLVREESR